MRAFLNDESGATAIEYGLIVGLIAVAIIVSVGTIGSGLTEKFKEVETPIANAK